MRAVGRVLVAQASNLQHRRCSSAIITPSIQSCRFGCRESTPASVSPCLRAPELTSFRIRICKV